MNLILEIGILLGVAVGPTPWLRKEFQRPYVLIEKSISDDFYFRNLNSARTEFSHGDTMEPMTALWQVGVGYRKDNFSIEIGHQSEHEVENLYNWRTESFHFIKAAYRVEYK